MERAGPRQPVRARASGTSGRRAGSPGLADLLIGSDRAAPVLADPVDRRAALLLLDARLDAGEPLVDAAPPGGDEIDEQREIVDARMPLGQEVALDALE